MQTSIENKRVTRSTRLSTSTTTSHHTLGTQPDQSKERETTSAKSCKTPKRATVCPLCNESFDNAAKFKVHKLHHAKDDRHECHVCLKQFQDVDKLFRHVAKHSKPADPTTTSTKVFQCSICCHTFDEIAALEIHIRTHLIAEPYTCSVCDAKYRHIQQLMSHIVGVHGETQPTYTCNFCNIICHNATQFSEHDAHHKVTNSVAGDQAFNCTECGHLCWSLDKLNAHKRTHMDVRKSYSCMHCVRCFSRSEDLHTHMRVHKGKPVFKCAPCGRMFAQAKNLSSHVQRIHRDSFLPDELLLIDCVVDNEVHERERQGSIDDKLAGEVYCLDVLAVVKALGTTSAASKVSTSPNYVRTVAYQPITVICANGSIRTSDLVRKYQCPFCALAFVKIITLHIHCKRNHPGLFDMEQLKEIERSGNEAYQVELQKFTMHECPGCGDKFDQYAELMDHMKSNHDAENPFKCADCDVKFSEAKALGEHVIVHLKKRHKCSHCGLAFQQLTSLQKHVKRHEGAAAMPCKVCGIPYKDEKDLHRHMRTHAEGKPHKCDYCDKRFAQSCDKSKHMRIHTGERPYTCQVCDKTFGHLTSYKKHQLVHTGERPFQCTVCGKSFQHNSNLVVHSRMHTGERPYKCNVCDKSFYASGHYADHMKIHVGARNYKCDVCPKSFLHLSSFQKHKRTHTGEKPFHCTMCDRRFSQPGHYKEHMRIHTGEKPYRCGLCEKTFRRSDALQGHMKTHVETPSVTASAVLVVPKADKIAAAVAEPMYTMETINYQMSNSSGDVQNGDGSGLFSQPHQIIIHQAQEQQPHSNQLYVLRNQPPQKDQEIHEMNTANMETVVNGDTSLLLEQPQQQQHADQQHLFGDYNSYGFNFNL